ncbi:uncharacterized protein PHACADRAFT_202392 [Phanerochaete carnosa HHB-10118-sp]|uniref:Uncharacterized protein n=1 Tax=Phanerochaete carnosa (strain HHB-10118-sp) TaxID=650164 RepID=K5WF72_PHACS|nr:uncharacterized protein PHACADRAFT_202392 [Phanerochaete carnosa HHB-10118-sp]EKM48792.1 hypothetical protein PHACADRAFT_202392 [Phanerochaete carnosa HHB-10118-sp]
MDKPQETSKPKPAPSPRPPPGLHTSSGPPPNARKDGPIYASPQPSTPQGPYQPRTPEKPFSIQSRLPPLSTNDEDDATGPQTPRTGRTNRSMHASSQSQNATHTTAHSSKPLTPVQAQPDDDTEMANTGNQQEGHPRSASSNEDLYLNNRQVVTLDEAIAAMPIPDVGLPPVCLSDPDYLHHRQLREQLLDWGVLPGYVVFTIRFCATLWTDEGQTVFLLEQTLHDLGFTVTRVAAPCADGHHRSDGPFLYAIYNLSQQDHDTLLDRFCWSTAPCTFFCWPSTPQLLLTYIGQYSGASAPMKKLAQLLAYLLSMHPYYADMKREQAIRRLLLTIQVTILRMSDSKGHTSWPLVNLYIDPLMLDN